jgi:CheY-like chemotaxis protein
MSTERGDRRILVAEDNPVNQRVLRLILEKAGYAVAIAGDGREAVACALGDRFDLILMDVQMPIMSGLEATSAIRASEAAGPDRVPIVGLSANAAVPDREAGLAAGMDAYLSKPIITPELLRVVDALTASAGPTEPGELDANELSAVTGGDADLLREVVQIFREDSAQTLTELGMGVERGDPECVRRAAHTLRGSMGVFGARSAVALAERLESMGRDGTLADAPEAVVALERMIDALKRELAAFVERV